MRKLDKLTLKDMLERSVEMHAERPSLGTIDGNAMTYAQLGRKVNEISSFLQEQGIIMGDRVALLSENMPNWGVSYLAITTMGAVVVPILPDFRPQEIHHILRNSKSKAIFVSQKLYDKLEDFEFELAKTVIIIDDFSLVPPNTKKEALPDAMVKGQARLNQFLDAVNNLAKHLPDMESFQKVFEERRRDFRKLWESTLRMTGRLPIAVEPDSLAAILYTSGTTGHSKGVMLTHENLVFNVLDTLKIQPIISTDRMLSILPLAHTYECTIGFLLPVSQGGAVYYLNKPPVAKILADAFQRIRPTLVLSVPLVIEKMYRSRILPKLTKNAVLRGLTKVGPVRKAMHKAAGKKLLEFFGGELHFFGVGGAKLARDVELFLREAEFPYSIGYGLTETSPLIAGCTPAITKFRSTGPTLPGLEVRIANPNSKTGVGEIQVRGASVMRGYYQDPEQTKEVMTEDGYFKTGDLGILDKDGYLFIKGRSKNVIIGASGENIYPMDIEAVINQEEYVMEALVYEQNGKLTARVHLDYERLDKEQQTLFQKASDSKIKKQIEQILTQIQKAVNAKLPTFSRLNRVIEQPEPFVRTPTKKIKRYLYTQ